MTPKSKRAEKKRNKPANSRASDPLEPSDNEAGESCAPHPFDDLIGICNFGETDLSSRVDEILYGPLRRKA